MTSNHVTYEQLDGVLRHLGFISRKVDPRWQRYEHPGFDTLIIVGDRGPTEIVLPSELLSARRHLIEKGHVDAEELEQLFAPTPPLQKTTASARTP